MKSEPKQCLSHSKTNERGWLMYNHALPVSFPEMCWVAFWCLPAGKNQRISVRHRKDTKSPSRTKSTNKNNRDIRVMESNRVILTHERYQTQIWRTRRCLCVKIDKWSEYGDRSELQELTLQAKFLTVFNINGFESTLAGLISLSGYTVACC